MDLFHKSQSVAGGWWSLTKQLAVCLWLSLQLVYTVTRWTLRQLTPVPLPVAGVVRRRTSTGLNVSPIDVSVLTFTLVVVVTQLW